MPETLRQLRKLCARLSHVVTWRHGPGCACRDPNRYWWLVLVAEAYSDVELVRLTAAAQAIDDEIAALRPNASASRLGSADRKRYAELRDRSADAWGRHAATHPRRDSAGYTSKRIRPSNTSSAVASKLRPIAIARMRSR